MAASAERAPASPSSRPAPPPPRRRAAGIAVIIGAPNLVRGGSHSGNVAAGELADAGLLDILSSDYAPASLLLGAVRLGLEAGDLARGLAHRDRGPGRAPPVSPTAAGSRPACAPTSSASAWSATSGRRAVWVGGGRVA